MNFYSQFGEDRWVWENIFGAAQQHRPTGRFCEVGAFDGVNLSNTKAFEEIGWRGICVEANPEMASRCIANRGCPIWCCAVGLQECAEFNLCIEHPDWSGIERPVLEASYVRMPVVVKRLDWLLEKSGLCVPPLKDGLRPEPSSGLRPPSPAPAGEGSSGGLDLLSIDTEGTELEVWESIGVIRPRVVVIEHLTGTKPSKAVEIATRMRRDGYRVVWETQCNLILELQGRVNHERHEIHE